MQYKQVNQDQTIDQEEHQLAGEAAEAELNPFNKMSRRMSIPDPFISLSTMSQLYHNDPEKTQEGEAELTVQNGSSPAEGSSWLAS